jgi:hypothetical protein
MTLDWQDIGALLVVAAAVAHVMLRAASFFFGANRSESTCGGCRGCQAAAIVKQIRIKSVDDAA